MSIALEGSICFAFRDDSGGTITNSHELVWSCILLTWPKLPQCDKMNIPLIALLQNISSS